jgi:aldose 1-epimerase
MAELFGIMPNGTRVHRHRLSNSLIQTDILEIGAAIQSIDVPDRSGEHANVVLGMKTLEDYRLRSPHFGAVPGRYAGRIAGGRFVIDGEAYQLACNAGRNAIHGGPNGFGHRVWSSTDVSSTHVMLRLMSADGEEGYPGEMEVTLRYSLERMSLRLDFAATTTKPTIVNLTNHSYFNLAGEGSGSVLNHELTINADRFLPVSEDGIPLGFYQDVGGSAFDFRLAETIGKRIRDANPQLLRCRGYDHAYEINGTGLREAAVLSDHWSGRKLTVSTTEPTLQLYTANNVVGDLVGLSDRIYRQSDAVCLEAQLPGDSPNQPALPQAVLRPGQIYRATTIFCFDPQ